MGSPDGELPPGRSAGVSSHGRLVRGSAAATAQSSDEPWQRIGANVATGKAETSKPALERSFGTATRFQNATAGADIPGPGSHFQPRNWLWQHDSVSRKGYGSGFVSKAQRLAGQIRYTGPGPGAYEQLEPEAKLWHLANRAVTIPKAKADELHDAKTASLPGPGAFEPTETRLGQRMAWTACPASQRSAFRASARAFSFAGGKGVPPVGAYNLAKRWQTKEVNHTNFKLAPGHVRPTARTTRPKSPQQLMSALASPAGSVLSPKPDPRDVLPGPGAYETQEVETIDKKLAGIAGKVSSMFGKAVVEADRFGRPIQPRADRGNMPGPGQHASEYGNFATSQRGTRAGFLDRSGRSMQHSMSALEHRPPGPAFYHAELPVKKHSFLTGEAHTFVPA